MDLEQFNELAEQTMRLVGEAAMPAPPSGPIAASVVSRPEDPHPEGTWPGRAYHVHSYTGFNDDGGMAYRRAVPLVEISFPDSAWYATFRHRLPGVEMHDAYLDFGGGGGRHRIGPTRGFYSYQRGASVLLALQESLLRQAFGPPASPLINPDPADPELYAKVKREAKKKFDVWPSIPASSWLTAEYKRRGGTYVGPKPKSRGLSKWYDEQWVDLARSIDPETGKVREWVSCARPDQGRGEYPKCIPLEKARKMRPSARLSAVRRKREAQRKDRRRSKGRSPTRVRTENPLELPPKPRGAKFPSHGPFERGAKRLPWRRRGRRKLPGWLTQGGRPEFAGPAQYEAWTEPSWLWYEGRDGLYLVSASFLVVDAGWWDGPLWRDRGMLYLYLVTHAWMQIYGPQALSLTPRSELHTLGDVWAREWHVEHGGRFTGVSSRPDCYVANRALPWQSGLGSVAVATDGSKRGVREALRALEEFVQGYVAKHATVTRARQTAMDLLWESENKPCEFRVNKETGWWCHDMGEVFQREAPPATGQMELAPVEPWEVFDVDPKTGAWRPSAGGKGS